MRSLCLPGVVLVLAFSSMALAKSDGLLTPGRLEAWNPKHQALGRCPLKHTDVQADISGCIARVTVRQQFHNSFTEKIEAVYVFPLSQDAAVDRMTMRVGDRTIRGEIKERSEARKIYEHAKAQGQVASLLDQERPNIFTQAVANIEPGAQVDITISYTETLTWKDGEYQFSFPTVVGPRYMPGQPTGSPTTGWAPPTTLVPDAHKISPPVTPEGTRAGHDISITVNLHAGLPLRRLDSRLHTVDVEYTTPDKSQAVIRLQPQRTIPNKDFVLHYETAGDEIADTLLTHTDERGKFFTLVLQPPKRVRQPAIVPKELYFVVDSSGSMQGFPIETAKLAMHKCIAGLHERDTFNLMTFSGHTSYCFERPMPNTPEHRGTALRFLEHLSGSGGTEMLQAIEGCLARQDDPERVRVVCFLTDGCVGNDLEIIDSVKRNAGRARVFCFGVGTAVNRFLLDRMAHFGRGEVQYILDERDAAGAAEKFYERVRTPVLTDVKVDFGGLEVCEVQPPEIPDLFSATPVVIKGQYRAAGQGTITLTGKTGEGKFERKIAVHLPEAEPKNEPVAPLWARAKVDDLMPRDLAGMQSGSPDATVKQGILELGLRYQLLTQFTSFVAVEEQRITSGGAPKTVSVPVEMPEGVSYEGVFGRDEILGSNVGGGGVGVGFGGRGAGSRKVLVGGFGGTKQSERTVASALNWLARHQRPDGSWTFSAPAESDKGYADPGTWKSDPAATSFALLPFLGAGQTHQSKGPYQKNIVAGLGRLTRQQKADGDLSADTTDKKRLTHALATLVLGETYGLTSDKTIGAAAQSAVDFLVAAQDTKTGGWADAPGQACTVTATVWQVLALQSAKQAGLNVPTATLEKASKFLDAVQADNGAKYGETGPHDVSDGATAAGLLSRLYLNRKQNGSARSLGGRYLPLRSPDEQPEPPALKDGIQYLSQTGPSAKDGIYNLHATVFMHHSPGPEWDAWNRRMRRQLIDSQIRLDAESGSWWNPDDLRAGEGGRLLQTAVNTMVLEVYYRYLPLYHVTP
ncbi:MAG: VIT domain-containing protein [Planctomycetota bacterium]|nr:VIT domain-containing protein [Planctomycetota bacterium]